MNPYSITLHALGETLSHAQEIFGYAVIWITGVVFCAFVASFAWCRLRDNQKARRTAKVGETVTIHISMGERPYPGLQAQRERFGDEDGQTDYSAHLEARRLRKQAEDRSEKAWLN